MNWSKRTVVPDEEDREPYNVWEADFGAWVMSIIVVEDGRYYAEAVHSCDAEEEVGYGASLERAKQICRDWCLNTMREMANQLGGVVITNYWNGEGK